MIVIGSGIGGLSAAALLAKYGNSVKVFESHYLAGGCCHMFDHRDKNGGLWKFEVGPSIWEGLDRPTGNPLRMVGTQRFRAPNFASMHRRIPHHAIIHSVFYIRVP